MIRAFGKARPPGLIRRCFYLDFARSNVVSSSSRCTGKKNKQKEIHPETLHAILSSGALPRPIDDKIPRFCQAALIRDCRRIGCLLGIGIEH